MVRGTHRYPPMERVIYGVALAEALDEEVNRLDARAVYVMASGTLNRETDVVDSVRRVLGNRFAGICAKIGSHTPRIDVVAAANEASAASADLLLTVGGGSVTDAAKMVGLCLGNNVTAPDQLDAFRAVITADGKTQRPPVNAPAVRSIDIPTTLSAGEFTAMAGCTDTVRHVKESYAHALMMPRAVIHLDARLNCQLGAWMSIMGSQNGVAKGASHGIGHVLGGTANVPHGYTSCIMLPHVLRFNQPVNADRQAWVSEALGRPHEKAADAVAALIAGLGLPATLRDVGVKPEQLDEIAAGSMHDRWVHTNPRKIDGPAAIRELLDAAW
jgi:maleylacetate reductase